MKKYLHISFIATISILSIKLLEYANERYVYFKHYSEVHSMYHMSDFSKPEEAEYHYNQNSQICDSKNIHKNVPFQTRQYHESKSKCIADMLKDVS
jgi:hypothetical protein